MSNRLQGLVSNTDNIFKNETCAGLPHNTEHNDSTVSNAQIDKSGDTIGTEPECTTSNGNDSMKP